MPKNSVSQADLEKTERGEGERRGGGGGVEKPLLSKRRDSETFAGLDLQKNLEKFEKS